MKSPRDANRLKQRLAAFQFVEMPTNKRQCFVPGSGLGALHPRIPNPGAEATNPNFVGALFFIHRKGCFYDARGKLPATILPSDKVAPLLASF